MNRSHANKGSEGHSPAAERSAEAVALEAPPPGLDDPSLYLNRELSLLAFQRRVLEEAQDPTNPLLERVNFLSIVGSNLDEFYMVRVAGLMRQVDAGSVEVGPDGMSAADQLAEIRTQVLAIKALAHRCLNQLMPELEQAGIRILIYQELTRAQQSRMKRYFAGSIFPALTPLAFDPGRPFPHISNLSLNLAVVIRDQKGEEHFARVKVPESLPQLIPIASPQEASSKTGGRAGKQQSFIWLEDVIAANLSALFPGMEVLEAHPFHVTRDAELAIQELEAEDLLETTEEGVRQRRFADVVRLQVAPRIPTHVLRLLVRNLEVSRREVFRLNRPLSFSRLKYLATLDRPELKYPPFVPRTPREFEPESEDENVFTAIRRRDVLLHHPFDSFQPVVDFLEQSARDADVLAMKMTLYRIGRNSPVVKALLDAAEEEKQVATLVELKARFDEESNIEWARALEGNGVHVVYGLLGLKVHSKATLVVRREGQNIVRYVHLGTGNYNPLTAHGYTDLGLFTVDEDIAADVTDLFNYLTGYSAKSDYRKLWVAPINLRAEVERRIRREIDHHRRHKNGRIILKMNALVDAEMIRLLYEASMAGVKIELLVRGICCLRPGLAGVSENVRVISVVGRFLEHSRIFYFHNNGQEEIYAGSADLMPRNLNRRVEVMFPVEDQALVRYLLHEVLEIYLLDNVKAREMGPGGGYRRRAHPSSTEPLNSQEWLLAHRGGHGRHSKPGQTLPA